MWCLAFHTQPGLDSVEPGCWMERRIWRRVKCQCTSWALKSRITQSLLLSSLLTLLSTSPPFRISPTTTHVSLANWYALLLHASCNYHGNEYHAYTLLIAFLFAIYLEVLHHSLPGKSAPSQALHSMESTHSLWHMESFWTCLTQPKISQVPSIHCLARQCNISIDVQNCWRHPEDIQKCEWSDLESRLAILTDTWLSFCEGMVVMTLASIWNVLQHFWGLHKDTGNIFTRPGAITGERILDLEEINTAISSQNSLHSFQHALDKIQVIVKDNDVRAMCSLACNAAKRRGFQSELLVALLCMAWNLRIWNFSTKVYCILKALPHSLLFTWLVSLNGTTTVHQSANFWVSNHSDNGHACSLIV